MACSYNYDGKMYSKEELIEQLAQNTFPVYGGMSNILKSAAVQKKKTQSDLLADTNLMLKQRYQDAKNMLQAINLNPALSKAEKELKKAEYRKIMNDLRDTIKDLSTTDIDKQLDFILNQALIDANLVDSLYNNSEITFNDFQFASDIVETWSSVYKVLGIESSDDIKNEEIKKKMQNVDAIYSDLSKKSRRIAIELIKESTGLKEVDITRMVDTSWFTEWARELGTAGVALPNKLAYLIKKVNIKINMEHNKNEREIEDQYESIKNHPEIKANGFNIFFKTTKDSKGEERLGLVSRYSEAYANARRGNKQMLKRDIELAKGDKTKIKLAWQRFNAWNEEHTIAFNSLIFLKPGNYTDDLRNTEVKKMMSLGFSKEEVDSIIGESQKLYEKFEEDLEAFRYDIEVDAVSNPQKIPQDMTFDEYVNMKVQEFDDLNNPLKYMDQKFFGAEKLTAYGGAKYSYLVPAKFLKTSGTPTNYYDANFARINSDPRLSKFYGWWTGFIKDSLQWLPQEEIEDLGPDFLPVIAERAVKEYGMTNLKESVAGLGEWFMKALTVSEVERKKDVNPFSKKERLSFKTKFIDENVKPEEQSKDMVLIAKIFSDMALVYKHKNTVKAEVDTIQDVVLGTEGSYKMNKKLGQLESVDKDASRIKSLVEHTVITSFYGIRNEDELWKSDKLWYDWKELASIGMWNSEKANKAKELSDRIKEINKKIDTENLNEDELKKLEEEKTEKEKEYYALGGRNFSFTRTIDSAISNTRLLALGFSPFSAIRNLLVGKINNRIHSYGGRDFSRADLVWANKLLLESAGKYFSMGKFQTKNTKIIFGLLSDAGLAEGEDGIYLKTMVNKKTSIDKFREMIPNAYTWLSSGDYHFKAEMLIAAMKKQKVFTSKGEFSFYEVLDENREFDSKNFGEWVDEKNGNKSFEDYYIDKLLKYKQLANKLHGATGRDINLKVKSNAIGRMLILFKSWLPETVGARFDPRHTDGILEREEEGYYRTFARLIVEKKHKIVPMIAQAFMNKNPGLEDDLEYSNFRKAIKELQIIVTLMIAYALLKAAAPDDDKDKKIYNLLVLRQLKDLNRDLRYYMSLGSAAELQKNIFPIVRTILDYGKAINAVAYHLYGAEDENGKEMYDSERTTLRVTKILPFLSNWNRINYYMESLD
jgi:hypothetical protein